VSRWLSEPQRRLGSLQRWLRAQTRSLVLRLRQPQTCFLGAPHGQAYSPLDAFASWCAEHAGTNARVLLSGALTHQYVFPLDGSQTLFGQARTSFARRHFVQYFGDQAQTWPLETWSNAQRHGACAVHGIDISALQGIAKLHRVRLQAVEPAWAGMLRWLSRRHPSWASAPCVALVLVERGLMTWLVCAQGSVVQIHQRRLQSATLQDLALRIEELKAQQAPTMPVWVGGYGLDCTTPLAAPGFHPFTSLDRAQLPPELLT
jgi:hypothetical protein